jgi:hypothetical protein
LTRDFKSVKLIRGGVLGVKIYTKGLSWHTNLVTLYLLKDQKVVVRRKLAWPIRLLITSHNCSTLYSRTMTTACDQTLEVHAVPVPGMETDAALALSQNLLLLLWCKIKKFYTYLIYFEYRIYCMYEIFNE